MGHVARIGVRWATCTFWWGDLRERPLGRPRRRWEDNIKMNLRETELVVVNWIQLTHDKNRCRAVANTIMKLRFP